MTKIQPVRINNQLNRVESQGKTFVFDLSVTHANVHGRRLHARQSTSVLVPATDTSVEKSREVGPTNFWFLETEIIKHYLMIQAPHEFILSLSDPTLMNNINKRVKRLYFSAGSFDGRVQIMSDVDQLVTVSYA